MQGGRVDWRHSGVGGSVPVSTEEGKSEYDVRVEWTTVKVGDSLSAWSGRTFRVFDAVPSPQSWEGALDIADGAI